MSHPGRADVIYSFRTTSFASTDPALPGVPLVAIFDLLDSVIAQGHFTLSAPTGNGGSTGRPIQYSGDVGAFRQLTIQGEVVTPTYLFGQLSTSLALDPGGNVTSSSLIFNGVSSDVSINGVGNAASGYLGSDDPSCNASVQMQRCTVSGVWSRTFVPEPPTAPVLVMAISGAALLRRRRV